jgi:signal transduction histidine kinase
MSNTTTSSFNDIALELKVLAKEKETARRELERTAKKLAVKAAQLAAIAKEKENVRRKLAVTAEKLVVTAKEKEEVRKKLQVTAEELKLKATELAVTAKEKEEVRKKLEVTAQEKEDVRKKLEVTAREKEDVRKKLEVAASELKQKAAELAATAKEKEEVRKKLEVTAEEKEEVRKKLEVTAEELKQKAAELAATAKEKEDVRKSLAVTAEQLKLRDQQLVVTAKEMEAFSYSVSHDLRAPLRAIDGFAQILVEDYGEKLDAEGKRITSIIRASTVQMGHLIDDLLSFSRLGRQEVKKNPVAMRALADEVYQELKKAAPERKIEFTLDELPDAKADVNMMRVVWTNLLSNAIKFTSKKDAAKIEVGSQSGDGSVTYFVKDNGAGFDMKYIDKLFGVFQRLHSTEEFEGTGVGLANVKRVVERHGGSVKAEGTVGEGATFSFTLPTA